MGPPGGRITSLPWTNCTPGPGWAGCLWLDPGRSYRIPGPAARAPSPSLETTCLSSSGKCSWVGRNPAFLTHGYASHQDKTCLVTKLGSQDLGFGAERGWKETDWDIHANVQLSPHTRSLQQLQPQHRELCVLPRCALGSGSKKNTHHDAQRSHASWSGML